MTSPLFVKVLGHTQKHMSCTKEDPILLLLDNHESHCKLDAVLFAREHGITMVTFPPHCTNRLQPLDVSAMGPLKSKYAVAQNDWMVGNPTRTITIHDLIRIVATAYPVSFTMKNILAGLEKPGIWPFSRNAFSNEDSEAASVRSDSNSEPCVSTTESMDAQGEQSQKLASATEASQADDRTMTPKRVSSFQVTKKLTPEQVRPYPTAVPRTSKTGGMVKGKSRILALTPEKEHTETLAAKRKASGTLNSKTKRKTKTFIKELGPYETNSESSD
jgi:hypothetical protein